MLLRRLQLRMRRPLHVGAFPCRCMRWLGRTALGIRDRLPNATDGSECGGKGVRRRSRRSSSSRRLAAGQLAMQWLLCGAGMLPIICSSRACLAFRSLLSSQNGISILCPYQENEAESHVNQRALQRCGSVACSPAYAGTADAREYHACQQEHVRGPTRSLPKLVDGKGTVPGGPRREGLLLRMKQRGPSRAGAAHLPFRGRHGGESQKALATILKPLMCRLMAPMVPRQASATLARDRRKSSSALQRDGASACFKQSQ